MKISKERLEKEASDTGFRPEILEKVIHLMGLLNDFSRNPFLSNRIALKAGTALNLFCYECPRLSVDIDINYIGSPDKNVMLQERDELIRQIEEVCLDKDYVSQRKPSEHAGGKWTLRYDSELPGNPRIEIDLNFLTRVPLWEIETQASVRLGSYQVVSFPVLNKHELAGGKFKALFSRHSSRDLFDTYILLQDENLDLKNLRIAFIVYGGMSRVDWRKIRIDDIHYEWAEFKNLLIPMLKKEDLEGFGDSKSWANTILQGCQEKLSQLLPFRENELAFLDSLLDEGEIKPELLTSDKLLQSNISRQPGLLWKALNVRKHRGI